MSAPMSFRGELVFATEDDLGAALRALEAADGPLRAKDFRRTNLLVELAWAHVVPSAFFEPTVVALGELGRFAWTGWIEARYGDAPPERFSLRKLGRPNGTPSSDVVSWDGVSDPIVIYALPSARAEPSPGAPSFVLGASSEHDAALRPDVAPNLTTLDEHAFLARLQRAAQTPGVERLVAWAITNGAPHYAFQLEPASLAGDGTARARAFERHVDAPEIAPVSIARKIDPIAWRCLVCGGTTIERRIEKMTSTVEARCDACGAWDAFSEDETIAPASEAPAPALVSALDDWIHVAGGAYVLGLSPDEARRLAEQCVIAQRRDEERDFRLRFDDEPLDRAIDALAATLLRQFPLREVKLEPFSITRVPVTNHDWRRFMEETGANAPAAWELEEARAPDLPVLGVSWDEANAFARHANAELPTEAQWQRVARGRARRLFPWGDAYDLGAFMMDADRQIPWSLRAHPELASEDGCVDLLKWSWEWCRDELVGDAELATLFGPRVPSGRAVCGGEGNLPIIPTTLSRTAFRPDWRSMVKAIGFRLVRRR